MIFKNITDELKNFNDIVTNISNSDNDIDKILKVIKNLSDVEANTLMAKANVSDDVIEKINLRREAIEEVISVTEDLANGIDLQTLSEEGQLQLQLLSIGADEAEAVSTSTVTAAQSTQIGVIDVLKMKYGQLAASIGISTAALTSFIAVAASITVAIAIFNHFYDTAEETSEKVKNLMNEFDSALKTANQNLKTIDDLADRYGELSEGVDELGRNISLSTDEFEEYNNIVNQIAEMSPELVKGYTAEGDAILSLKGNVDELKQSYIDAQKEAYNLLIASGEDSDGNDIVKQWHNLSNDDFWNKDIFGKEAFNQIAKRDVSKLIYNSNGDVEKLLNELSKYVNEYGYGSNEIWDFVNNEIGLKIGQYNGKEFSASFSGNKITSDDINNIRQYAYAVSQTYQSEINSALNDVRSLANAYLMVDPNYSKLSDDSKNIASILVNTLTEDMANEFNDKTDVGEYVTNIVETISGLSNKEGTHEAQKALIDLFSLPTDEMSVNELKSQVDDFINIIAKFLNEDPIELKIRLGFDDVDDIYNRGQTSISKIAKTYNLTPQEYSQKNKDDYSRLAEYTKDFDESQWETWLNVTDGTMNATEAIYAYEEALKAVNEEVKNATISDSIDTISKQLEPQYKKLGDMYSAIFSSDNGFDSNVVDNAMLLELKETFSKLEDLGIEFDSTSLKEFFDVVADGNFTVEEGQEAFNNLATSWFYSTDVLDNLNSETAAAIEQQLEMLGVTNAHEVVTNNLSTKTEALALKDQMLAAETEAVANKVEFSKMAFIAQAEASDLAKNYLFALMVQEQLFNGQPLSTEEKIRALADLAKQAGQTSIELAANAALMKVQYGGGDFETEFSKLMTQVNSLKQAEPIEIGDMSKAGKDGADAYLEAFEKELERLQALRDQGKITEKQYLEEYRKLYEKYFKDIDKYAEEFAKHQHEYLSGMKSLYEQVFSAITSVIDEQIEAYQDQKEAAEEYYDSQIEKIDEQIEKINKSREAREDEMAVQKALYDLIRANNQRTVKTLDENGNTVYKADQSSVRENQDNYQNAKEDYELKRLEKKREEYEKLKEKSNEYYDNLIKDLEKYKERWEDLLELEERAKMLALIEEFGYTEQDILNMSEEAFEDLKIQYLQVLKDMHASNDNVLKHLSDISGVDMNSLEGHLQTTADLTGDVADGFKDIADGIKKATGELEKFNDTASTKTDEDKDPFIYRIKTYGEILNEFILKIQGAEERIASMAHTNPYQTPSVPNSSKDSSKSDSNSPAPAPSSTKSIVTDNGAILTPVNNLSLKATSVDISKMIPNNSVNQISSNIANQIAKAIKTNTTRTVQLTQQVTINAPYLTNESGYNRLMDEFRGLSSAAIIDSINTRNK